MVRFLLDILSEPLRPQPNLTVIQRLTDQGEELSTASIVYHEMLFGWRLPESKKAASDHRVPAKSKQTDYFAL